MFGRHVYGAASIALGILGIATAGFAKHWHPVPEGIPYRYVLAYAASAVMCGAGLGLQSRKTIRAAMLLAAAVYTPFALLWLQRVVGFPHLFGTWSGFAQQFVPVIAPLFVAGTAARWPAPVLVGCRALVGACMILLGLAHFIEPAITASLVPKWIPLGQRFWALATGLFMILAGVSIAIDVHSARAARLLAMLLLSFGVFVWVPRLFSDPRNPIAWGGFAITMLVCGSAWMVADSLAGRTATTNRTESPRKSDAFYEQHHQMPDTRR